MKISLKNQNKLNYRICMILSKYNVVVTVYVFPDPWTLNQIAQQFFYCFVSKLSDKALTQVISLQRTLHLAS